LRVPALALAVGEQTAVATSAEANPMILLQACFCFMEISFLR
jgi:hypothetical protein